MANQEVTTVSGSSVLSGMGSVMLGGASFKTARWVTRTVLRQVQEVPFYVQFENEISLSTMDPDSSKFKDGNGEGAVPEIANVVNLETGEFQVLIINTVLGSELRRAYPDGGYVGRMFAIMQTKSDVDKRYKAYKIIELELDRQAPGGATATNEIDATGADAIDRAKKNRHKAG